MSHYWCAVWSHRHWFLSTVGQKIIHSLFSSSFLNINLHWCWLLVAWVFLLFSLLYLSALPSEFFEVQALLCFSYLESWLTISALCGQKKKNHFDHSVDNIKQMFWQISGRPHCLVDKFWVVCKVFTCFDSESHWHVWFQCNRN